ncbi:saccharopine dehydrogenase NADP-binding domain-containing protein [Streptomyces sp. WMMB303]|uniref:saccharopine dehydrogenase family protein n=1 Tax=Streptomyces sp. WMMB303 TaxID=3034154 RepID=UPI0023ED87F9|nr:saccharopine dehydrogenase NADP-binding domain-containing protein [Streptomyces sp. WMMB303]MDF4252462.1 saccharopine dehydrogenase NADP-binding domain-containing protein [Streptomyces sp. WMMB303]
MDAEETGAAAEKTAAPERQAREFDVVLFGATGFVGELTARYLAANAPGGCRWALAGRSERKLKELRERLAAAYPDAGEVPLITADADDPHAAADLAERSRVVASTVGPYLRYGIRLVAACADAGTDYLDLSGEPEFVDLMYLRHHSRARRTGARLVHACGFDSVPHDLGAHFTVQQLPEGVPLSVDGFVRSNAAISGGTFASALLSFSRADRMARTAKARRAADPRPADRSVRTPTGRVRHEDELGLWAVPLPTIDGQIVGRSAAALERYGPQFTYRHYAGVRRLPVALGGIAGAGGLFAAAQLPPLRRFLTSRLVPGEGPDERRRARSWFSVRFLGRGGGRRVVTEVAGGDPGYDETAKMFAEAALCLAHDDLPPTSGQVTTAVAMGEALTARLIRAGVEFRVLEDSEDTESAANAPH